MSRKPKQDWTPGATVRVGFMTLTVVRKVPTPGDYRPDQYQLIDAAERQYTFTPHHGLTTGWEA